MADVSHEPSMEEILSSIKKIISEDSEKSLSVPRARRSLPRDNGLDDTATSAKPKNDDVLELTELQPEEAGPIADAVPASLVAADAKPAPEAAAELVSPVAAAASRQALESLATMVAKPAAPTVGLTIDDLARELLRPMLKEWLDQHLPSIVESVVAKEVARISGR
jgi:uncharacterized protein